MFLAHLVEVVSNNLPDPGPLQSDASHVVVGDLHYFLKAEHAWVCGRGQLIHGHSTQPAHKINCQDRREDAANVQEKKKEIKCPNIAQNYLWAK